MLRTNKLQSCSNIYIYICEQQEAINDAFFPFYIVLTRFKIFEFLRLFILSFISRAFFKKKKRTLYLFLTFDWENMSNIFPFYTLLDLCILFLVINLFKIKIYFHCVPIFTPHSLFANMSLIVSCCSPVFTFWESVGWISPQGEKKKKKNDIHSI